MAAVYELTTGQYAKRVGKTIKTIRSWCDKGKLNSFLTPGGHRRIRVVVETPLASTQYDFVIRDKKNIPVGKMGAILEHGWMDISINAVLTETPMLHVRRTALGFFFPAATWLMECKVKGRQKPISINSHASGDIAVFVAENYKKGDNMHVINARVNILRQAAGRFIQVIEVQQVYKEQTGIKRRHGVKRIA